MQEHKVDDFFRYARERYTVFRRKERAVPRPEWTDDPILQDWYFTNIFREDDAVTRWFKKNVRNHLSESGTILPVTVLFRWFNKPEIGEVIFKRIEPYFGCTPWDKYCQSADVYDIIGPIRHVFPKGPYVNGAYIIKGYDGYDKLEGVARAFHGFMNDSVNKTLGDWRQGKNGKTYNTGTMQGMTEWLATFDQMGMFMAYEVACDLRWTKYLRNADDIMTWANPGPGARRGLSRLYFDEPDRGIPSHICIRDMQKLLEFSHCSDLWPNYSDWPDWEMREVEHTLCEFDKYERIRQGGKGKRRYARS